jgi:molybdopterin converting factor small subunit
MEVDVHLFSTLQKKRFRKARIQLQEGACITDVLSLLAISQDDVGILIVNHQDATFHQQLHESDAITIIPPIGGG